MTDALKPARFDEETKRPFGPKIPWKLIVGVGLALALLIGGYRYRERSKAHILRQAIAARYEADASPVGERLDSFRERIETWVLGVRDDEPDTWADPRLNLGGLHRKQGLYLRIHESQMTDGESLASAARAMEPDAITRCLGLAPVSLRGFYHRAGFFDGSWLDEVRSADDVLRLEVLEHQLGNRLEQDAPLLMDMVHSVYFLLVVQTGESRRDHPVRVYLWDVRGEALLLRTQALSRGDLMNVRIGSSGNVVGAATPTPSRSGAIDCSIAAQIRAAAGGGVAEVTNVQPAASEDELSEDAPQPPRDADTAADMGAREGSERAPPTPAE